MGSENFSYFSAFQMRILRFLDQAENSFLLFNVDL